MFARSAFAKDLSYSGIIRIIQPFWPNVGRRLTKIPKLYFMDTGHVICQTEVPYFISREVQAVPVWAI